MNGQTRLVIVIPTKDRRALLERALGSVFSQSYAAYRVVIINDGSTDDTRDYLDALHNPRVQVIHHEKSLGVNTARNAAFRTLQEGEWAVPLDDDDLFLPDAFDIIARSIEQAPASVSVIQFSTTIRTRTEEFSGTGQFEKGRTWHDFSYSEVMTGVSFFTRGEPRTAFKWTLFPHYLFSEDVNGFEGEWWLLAARDEVGIRLVSTPPVVLIDWRHEGEHLSDTASRRNPASFARAHLRILNAHRAFFNVHPRFAAPRAITGFKVAVRALNPVLAARFIFEYLRAISRTTFTRGSE